MTSTVASVLNLQSALGVKFITNPRRLKKKKKTHYLSLYTLSIF